MLLTFEQICNFRDPNLVAFKLCMYLILNKQHFTFNLQYKHSGTFANSKYEELSSSILLKMRPHDSQSGSENATPFSGTSPLASYKEVLPGNS